MKPGEKVIRAQQVERLLADIQRERQRLQAELDKLTIQEETLQGVLGKASVQAVSRQSRADSFTSRLIEHIRLHPGAMRDEAMMAVDATDDPEKRRSLLTQVGNLVRTGRLRQDADRRLYLPLSIQKEVANG